MKKIIFMAMLFVAGFTPALMAQKPEIITSNRTGWYKIGDATVDYRTDKDRFVILGKDRFSALQVKVNNAPLNMRSMTIYYENGRSEIVRLRDNFRPGTESRIIPLKNRSARLKRVTFNYSSIRGSRERAEIELWGRK